MIPELIIWSRLGAFSDCKFISRMDIPDNINEVTDKMFMGYESFSKITLHEKFILICSMESYAEEYARKHKLRYQLV